jgi:hypothetical protein
MGRAITILISTAIIAAALLLGIPRYEIVVGGNQSTVWRVNMRTGEIAVCTSPDLPAAGCRSLPGSSTDYQVGGAPQQTGSAQR